MPNNYYAMMKNNIGKIDSVLSTSKWYLSVIQKVRQIHIGRENLSPVNIFSPLRISWLFPEKERHLLLYPGLYFIDQGEPVISAITKRKQTKIGIFNDLMFMKVGHQ